ncbi:MAG: ABC transporter permease [Chloroflexi bacterium]|nr:ABC transporter permease [Chloroflexota bacterium]MCY3583299.1 ABC transporter permease [Chloroflexota bacterium]MCY3716360.1 ABC transporter permease [Chloroflexota bacterium]MDE2649440.1 ABC transporter permease [Chloroflexota bacterium]MXX51578.1 ABC transporter permease [Chloroflexota bacterium]
MSAAKSKSTRPRVKITRRRIIAAALLLLGIFIWLEATQLDPGLVTTLTFESTSLGETPTVGVLPLPTSAYLLMVGALFIVSGGINLLELAGRWRRVSLGLLVLCGALFIPTIIIAAAAGNDTNVTTIVAESLRLATPLAIGAFAGIWCERAGVVNIAIEGMMLFAACFGFVTLFFLRGTDLPLETAQLLAVVIGLLSGGLIALLHGWLSITFRTDQIVSGTVINILAVGITSFVRREYLLSTEAGAAKLGNISLPILSDIPIIGEAIFTNQPIFFMMFVMLAFTHLVMFHTRWGLRTRAVGEHPHAADTLGINVNRTRWINVFVSGMIAGLAGAWFSLEATGSFNDGMTRGAGFIALAAMIFGKWTPLGAFGAALLFGFSDSLGIRLQMVGVGFPVQFLQMVPYAVTLVVLAGFIGRASPPKAVGQPYVKE